GAGRRSQARAGRGGRSGGRTASSPGADRRQIPPGQAHGGGGGQPGGSAAPLGDRRSGTAGAIAVGGVALAHARGGAGFASAARRLSGRRSRAADQSKSPLRLSRG